MFGNNSEKLGYYDSPWSLTEVSADGNTIYKGRPSNPEASEDDPVWTIIRVKISYDPAGNQRIETCRTSGSKNKWSERNNLTYQLI